MARTHHDLTTSEIEAVAYLAALSASRAVATDASGLVVSSATTATELGYVSGVTSAIQTQLDAKPDLADNNTWTGTNKFSNTVTIDTLLVPDTDGGAAIGTTALGFSAIHLDTGGVINFDNGNYTLTHSSGVLVASRKFAIGENDIMVINGFATSAMFSVHNSGGLATQNIEVHQHDDVASGSIIYGAKSRGTGASPTVVQNGDTLLGIVAVGYDGTDYATSSAIYFGVDGTPGSNDMPGNITFAVSPDGSQTLGTIGVLSSTGSFTLGSVAGTGTGDFYAGNGIFTSSRTTTNAFSVTASSLTTGQIGYFYSNSVDTSTRDLFSVVNDNTLATNATAVRIQQDALAPYLGVSFGSVTTAFRLESHSSNTGNYGFTNLESTGVGPRVVHVVGTGVNRTVYMKAHSNGSKTVYGIGRSSDSGATYTPSFSITAGGAVCVGADVPRAATGVTSIFEIEGTTNNTSSMLLAANANDATTKSHINFIKSRGTVVGDDTIVQSGDALGGLFWHGTDGTLPRRAALIQAFSDGTPGASDMPGRLELATSASGSIVPTTRMVISSTGEVTLGTTPGTGVGSFYSGNVQIGHTADTANKSLTITSDAKSFISLVADSTNTNEDDTAYIVYNQDGGGVVAWAGVTGNANQLPDGTAYSGINANTFVIGHSAGSNNGVAAIVRVSTTSSIAWQVSGTSGAHVFNTLATTSAGYTFNHTNTTANALTITGTTLTTGSTLRVYDNGADTGSRNVAFIENDNALATANIALRVKQDSTANAVFIDANDNGIALNIDSENTTAIAVDVVADALTSGSAGRFYSNSSDATARSILNIKNDHASATGVTTLYVENDSTGNAATFTGGATGGNGLFMQFDSLTSGSVAYFYSNSASITGRNLVQIINDHASSTGTTPLSIQQDALTSTHFQKITNFGGTVFWRSNGTTPNGNLSGTAGDICVNGASNQAYYCTGTTNWTALGGSSGVALFAQTANVTIANTVTETTIIGTGAGSTTLAAGLFTQGKSIRITFGGYYSSVSSTSIIFRIKIGGSTVCYSQGTIPNGSTTGVYGSAIITCRTTGASGTVIGQNWSALTNTSDVATFRSQGINATTTVDTTGTLAVDVSAQWGAASASNTITITNVVIESL